jgi:hypothetical protein
LQPAVLGEAAPPSRGEVEGGGAEKKSEQQAVYSSRRSVHSWLFR